jgi:hypothetical protein
MFDFTDAYTDSIVVHFVGNKQLEEKLILSNDSVKGLNEEMFEEMKNYLLSSFRTSNFYNFSEDLEAYKEMQQSISGIFDEPDILYEESKKIAERLYENSNHPKIKGGELFVVYFTDCVVEDEQCDAIGLFKSENKSKFLKVLQKEDNFRILSEEGISMNKIDKACLIFNTEKEMGYKACLIDNVSRGDEAKYWKDDFLGLKAREDNFYYTVNQLKMCKGFIEEAFTEKEDFSKSDRIDILNRSVEYFDKNEQFTAQSFNEEVMEKPELIEAFNEYKEKYQTDNNLNTEEEFEISRPAFKGTKKYLRSVLKLDKNFHVYIHGKRDFIEKGYDEEKGMNYYQLFFEEEN